MSDLESKSSTRSEQKYARLNLDEEEKDIDVEHDIGTQDNGVTERDDGVWWNHLLTSTWLPEDVILNRINGQANNFLTLEAVKLMKFLIFSLLGFFIFYFVVRWTNLEHDQDYNVQNFLSFDFNLVLLDVIVFFVVGRLYQQPGIDHGAWILTCSASIFYTSVITIVPWARHSFTLYEMHCSWPWQLWIFCCVVIATVSWAVWKHIHYAFTTGLLGFKIIEVSLCFIVFLGPVITSPYFHFHHWFAGWLVGMHCNFSNQWWSRLVMAWCWGQYINGIAVYGRDPVLTCEYGFYISSNARCSYLDCFTHQVNGTNETVYNVPDVPDWRNCSSRGAP